MLNGKVLKQLKPLVGGLTSLAFLVVVVVGLVAYFSDSVSVGVYLQLAVVTVGLMFALAYFEWVRVRAATVFAVTAGILLAAVLWLQVPEVKKAQYQAVFLTNGQVYFGHLENASSKSPVLRDIYYLQSTPQNPQAGSDQQQQPQLSLIKLGNELHGPEDKMVLKADQILFWENLKDNSKVVETIKQSQKQ